MFRKRFTIYEEFRDVFDIEWEAIKEEFFKLETLQIYQIDVKSPRFQSYQRGNLEETRKLMREVLLSHPTKPHEKIKEKNIKFRRVHIVELPLSFYIRFELESYKISIELGEEIYLISKEESEKLKRSVEFQDFLMFDNKRVYLLYFDSMSEWKYAELIDDPKEIKGYIHLKEQLLKKSLLMDQFLQKYKLTI